MPTEALILSGDLDGAEEQLRQALEIVNNFGERIYLPQLLLLEAAIARGRNQSDRARESTRARNHRGTSAGRALA